MKWLAASLLTVLLLLQYRLWLSNDGVREVLRLRSAVATQQGENSRLNERNWPPKCATSSKAMPRSRSGHALTSG